MLLAMHRILAVPLAWKLAGANILIALTAVGIEAWGRFPPGPSLASVITGLAITVATIINFALVRIALQPLLALEAAVARVASGDFEARVPRSPFADRDMTRVAAMVNALLDTLSGDRSRLRLLASRVIDAGDRQRAEVAHELCESTAQTLTGLAMQISVEAKVEADPSRAGRLASFRQTLKSVTEEVQQIAQEMHPRVLEELGLPAALRALARSVTDGRNMDVSVDAKPGIADIPVAVAAGLYRTAEEALTNAVRHGSPSHIDIRLFLDDESLVLEVVDDGEGFATDRSGGSGPGTGLFTMHERLSLLDGTCHIRSARGEGTRVIARVPRAARSIVPAGASHER